MPLPPQQEPSPSPDRQPGAIDRLLFAVTLIVLSWTAVLVVTGGVDLRNLDIPFSSRNPFRPAGVAAVLVLAYTAVFRSSARAHLLTLRAAVDRWAPLLAIAAGVYVFGVALRFGCSIAAGSDSYGYVSQADLWLAGTLTVPQPIAREMPWALPEWTFSPLGYRPAQTAGAIVPIYPPGLPILMALSKGVTGYCGPYFVVPLLGALLVWLTYSLGVRLASRPVGLAAAVLLAASPTFVSQLLRPMSDVPVATFLVAAVIVAIAVPRGRQRAEPHPPDERDERQAVSPRPHLRSHLWVGLLLSLAFLVRPNLAPLAALFLAFAWFRERDSRHRLTAIALLAAGLLPGVLAIAAIHTHLYGAPWKSGYGSLQELYALRYAWTNLVRYPRWLFATQSLLVVAFLVPLIVWSRGARVSAPRKKAAWFLGVLIGAVWLSYLFYLPFDDWSYLRFVLASLPLMLVLAVVGWQLLASRLRWESRAAVVLAIFLVVVGFEVGRIQNLVILGRWRGECAEMNLAEFVSRNLPSNAVIVSMHFSGLLRHYAHRQTLRYDWLDPNWRPRAPDVLTAKGYRPYIVLIDWEEPEFRQRFGLAATPDAAPLGTVIAELGHPARVRVYDPTPASSSAFPASPTSPSSFGAPAPSTAAPHSPDSPVTRSSASTGSALAVAASPGPVSAGLGTAGPTSAGPASMANASPPVGKPVLISSDAPCPCTWRPGSLWQ